jgi:hypothetical protein
MYDKHLLLTSTNQSYRRTPQKWTELYHGVVGRRNTKTVFLPNPPHFLNSPLLHRSFNGPLNRFPSFILSSSFFVSFSFKLCWRARK